MYACSKIGTQILNYILKNFKKLKISMTTKNFFVFFLRFTLFSKQFKCKHS